MAKKGMKREWVWLQCKACDNLNYRTTVSVVGGFPKMELEKYCSHERKRTTHKLKRK